MENPEESKLKRSHEHLVNSLDSFLPVDLAYKKNFIYTKQSPNRQWSNGFFPWCPIDADFFRLQIHSGQAVHEFKVWWGWRYQNWVHLHLPYVHFRANRIPKFELGENQWIQKIERKKNKFILSLSNCILWFTLFFQ